LCVTPTLRIAVLQPDECSSNIGRAMLGVMHDNWLFAPGGHEDLDRVVTVAIRPLIQRALDARAVRLETMDRFFSELRRASKG
jgi:hypothetical protein